MNKYLLIFFLSLTLLCSCSDDNAPADANENFITSVILTVENDSYEAVINDGTITITVPYTVSLDGATASFAYTPSAKIYPNPQEITNWDEERVFRVVSYNGDERQYTYTVIKDDIREDGDVVLKSAADITAFAEKGTSVINGNLTIGTNDGEDIANLSGLENLKEVTGAITVLDNFKGTDFTGLDNLKKVGGINIGSEDAYSTSPLYLFSFNSLEEVTGDINIYNNSVELVDFKNLPSITGSVNIASPKLKSITAENLMEISGDFVVSCKNDKAAGGEIKEFTLPEIVSIGGKLSGEKFANLETIYFPKLQTVGSIIFEDLPFDVHRIDFPEIVEINGDLIFNSYTTFQIIGGITTGNTNLQTFDGFNKLQKVSGGVTITAFTEASNIPDVSNATIGSISLERLSKLGTLNLTNTKFAKHNDENCNVKFMWMPIEKIIGSKTMECAFIFENCDFYTYDGLPSFENIETIGGLFVGQPYSQNYDKFVLASGIKRINGYLQIDLCTTSTDATVEMPNLTEVTDYVYISAVPDQIMFNVSFPSLTTVGGQFYIGSYGINSIDLSSLSEVSANKISDKLAIDVLFEQEKDFEMGYGLNLCFRRGTDISLAKLEKVGGKGMKIDLPYRKISSFSCPMLKSVATEMVISGTSSSTLDGLNFTNLAICPKVTISTFKNLYDFSSFATLFTNGQIASPENWKVSGCAYNPTYQEMKEGRYKTEE